MYTYNSPVKTKPEIKIKTPPQEQDQTLFRTSFGYRRKTEMPINTNHPLNLLTKEVQMRQAQINEFTKISVS